MSGYTRQQSYIDGDVILAEHTNDEFDLIAEVFSTSLGHKHDGTLAEGPTIDRILDDDADTGIEVERTTDVDTIFLKTATIDRMSIGPTGDITAISNAIFNGTVDMNSTVTVDGATTFSTRPAFNGGTTGVDSPFTVDSTFLVTNLNSDLLDGLNSTQFLRSDVADQVDGVLTYTAIPSFNGGTSGVSAPFIVDSTFKVTNLNADLLDSLDSSQFVRSDTTDTVAGVLTFNAIPAFNGGLSGASAPFTVDSTFLVTDLNADLLDGVQGSSYLRSDANDNYSGGVLTVTVPASTAIESSLGSINTIQVFQSVLNADALISFHVSGDHAVHFGLDGSRNDLVVGGWSKGANSYLIWHEGNDGTGSGLDSDLLDGVQGASYTRSDVADTISGLHTHTAIPAFNGGLSGVSAPFTVDSTFLVTNLNADLLDGIQGSSYLRSDIDDTFNGRLAIDGGTVDFPLLVSSTDSGGGIGLSDNTSTSTTHVSLSAFGNDLLFRSGNTEKVRLLANGNLGIGTATPERLLHITGNEPAMVLEESDQIVDNKKWRVLSAGSSFTIDAVNDAFSTASLGYQILRSGASVTDHRFLTSNSERARIDPAGRFFVHSTDTNLAIATTGGGFLVRDDDLVVVARATAGSKILTNHTNYVSGTTTHIDFREGGTVRGSITSNGTNTAYNTTSDYRLKENVIDLADATSRLKELQPKRFNFVGKEMTVDGFLAHEVQVVVPEAVTGEKDGEETDGTPIIQQMDASKLIPLLVATIKELEERITALEGAQ